MMRMNGGQSPLIQTGTVNIREKNAAENGSAAWGLFFGGGVILGHFSPVDHAPDRLEIIGASVLVLQVVGVLPNVHAKNGLARRMGSPVGRARCRHRVRPKIPRQNHSERAARNIRTERAGG